MGGSTNLKEIGDVLRQLVDLGVVVLLNLLEGAHVVLADHKVDGHTLTTETATATDSVQVVLNGGGEVVVDNQRDLLDVNTSGQEIG